MGLTFGLSVCLLAAALMIRFWPLLREQARGPEANRPGQRVVWPRGPISRDEINLFLWDLYRADDLIDRLRRELRS